MEEKILILDADIDMANILKEQISGLGFFKVYLSTHGAVLQDVADHGSYQYLFADSETIRGIDGQMLKNMALKNPKTKIILMCGEYNQQAQFLQNCLGAALCLEKPIAQEDLKEIFHASQEAED